METEQTLVLIKPDGVQRGLVGEIIARYEHKGLKIVAMKLLQLPLGTAEALYAVHHGKVFLRCTHRIHDIGTYYCLGY